MRLLPTSGIGCRGKLDIRADTSLVDGLQELIVCRAEGKVSGIDLDMALRSLIAALQDSSDLNATRLDYVCKQLGPLWRRWREDILCTMYC
jgi:hypothetical protein